MSKSTVASAVFVVGKHRPLKDDPTRVAVSVKTAPDEAELEDRDAGLWGTLWLGATVAQARMRPGTRGVMTNLVVESKESGEVNEETGLPYINTTFYPTKDSIKVTFEPPKDAELFA